MNRQQRRAAKHAARAMMSGNTRMKQAAAAMKTRGVSEAEIEEKMKRAVAECLPLPPQGHGSARNTWRRDRITIDPAGAIRLT